MAGAGLPVPEVIHGDGTLYRFSTNGKHKDQSGWYVLHDDGDVAAGAFGDWRSGISQTWCSKDTKAMTQTERRAHQQRMQAIAQQRDADTAHRHQQAAKATAARWQAASPATAHPYLTSKGVQAHGVKVEADGFLIVPMRDTAGKLWNIERINPADSKDKKGLYGGRRTGLYHSIGKPDGAVIVCEGYATGASIHEATGQAVAVAFNAGNLQAVAVALRAKYPCLTITIASDDDWKTAGNPGLAAARQAALAVGGKVAVPDFTGLPRGDKDTDFNDLHRLARAGVNGGDA